MSAYTQAQLDAIKKAYARGVRKVTYDGQTVEFESGEEMRKRIAEIEESLSAAAGNRKPKSARVQFSRGYR